MTSAETGPDVCPIIASVLVTMPGAGSDGHYARRALGPLADALRLPLVDVDPGPRGIVATYLDALDDAASRGPVVAAGISIGACVAVHWAATRPGACAAVVAACPPWLPGGSDGSSPAAAAARATVAEIDRGGLDDAIAGMRASSPDWLGDELARSWTALRPWLADHLREAASTTLPTPEELRGLTLPTAVVAVDDDPVHPTQTARAWADTIGVRPAVVAFDAWAADPGVLGRAAAEMLQAAQRTR